MISTKCRQCNTILVESTSKVPNTDNEIFKSLGLPKPLPYVLVCPKCYPERIKKVNK